MKTVSKIIPVRGLADQGIISDAGAFNLGTNQITEGTNLRVESNHISSVNGWRNLVSSPDTKHIAPWFNRVENSIIETTVDKINWYRTLGNVIDVTPDDYSNGNDWVDTQHGDWIILTSKGQSAPYVMSPNDVKFTKMAGFPANELIDGIVSYNGHLIAWGIQIDAEINPYLIHWSDALAPNSMNPSWDFADNTSLSGTNELAGGNGQILHCEKLADRLFIYQEFGVALCQWVGGQYIFSFRNVFSDDGLLNARSVCNFGGRHFCVGQHSIYIHDGVNKVPVAEKRVEREFFNTLRNPDSVKVLHNPEKDEVWVTYSDTESSYANKVLVYNYNYDAYTFRSLPDGISNVIRAPKMTLTYDSWGNATSEYWNRTTEIWQKSTNEKQDAMLIYHDTKNGNIIHGDYSLEADEIQELTNEVGIESYLQQSKLDMEELVGDSVTVKMLTSVYPQITGSGKVRVSIGGSDTANGAIQFDYIEDFDITTGLKVDCQVSYRYLAIRYDLIGLGKFNISGHDLEMKVRGEV